MRQQASGGDGYGANRVVVFDGLQDIADYCKKGNSGAYDCSWVGITDTLRGMQSVATIADYLTSGIGKLGQEVQDLADSIQVPRVADVRRRNVWCEMGDEVDMDRVRAGRMEVAWRAAHRSVSTTPPRIRIMADVLVSADVNANRLKWRGIAACAVLQALRAKGYSVALTVGLHAPASGMWDVFVNLIPFGSPISAATLAAGAVHPAFFRALCHGIQRVISGSSGWGVYGYSLQQAQEPALRFAGVGTREKLIFVPANCLTEAAAKQFVADSVAEVKSLRVVA